MSIVFVSVATSCAGGEGERHRDCRGRVPCFDRGVEEEREEAEAFIDSFPLEARAFFLVFEWFA